MIEPTEILVSRCSTCHGRFLPRPGPCPFCGSREVAPESLPGEGRVLAATELTSPSAGWPAPHRLVLVELAQAVRVLAIASEAVPPVDAIVRISRDGELYRVVSHAAP